MKVKFDLVRIGVKRKDYHLERVLKNNVHNLKSQLCYFLEKEDCSHKGNTEHVTMIIPAKGYNIKILIEDFKDMHIRDLIKSNFSKHIYRGNKDLIRDSFYNRIFYP